MKKLLLITTLLFLFVLTGYSQQGQRLTPEQRLENIIKELKSQIELTDEKLAFIEESYKNFYKEVSEMRSSQGGFDREKITEKRQKLSEHLLTKLTKAEHDCLIEVERSLRQSRRPQ